jgi:hypothetical protein
MKAKSATWIAFILAVLSVTNCTIEKRLFQPGYSIEWKKKVPQKDATETTNRVSDSKKAFNSIITDSSSIELFLAPENLRQEILPSGKLSKSVTEFPASTEIYDTITSDKVENAEVVSVPHQKKAVDLRETEDKKELELFGVMSFGLYICSLAFAILALVVFNLPVYLFGIAGFMILLSLIFGIISVDKSRRDKSRYYRNFFGYFGLIASVVTISVVIGILILTSELGSF